MWVRQNALVCLVLLSLFVLLLLYSRIQPGEGDPLQRRVGPVANGVVQANRAPRLVVYNRIPKTASTTVVNAIGYDRAVKVGFRVVHLNATRSHAHLDVVSEARLIRNITEWAETRPTLLHGHFHYINFRRFGTPSPVWINVVREPLERLVSYYYFLRSGDSFRPGLKRSRAGNNETFDECVSRGGWDCAERSFWIQIPYFCGHHHFCSVVGSQEALVEAKRVLAEEYLLVGYTERLREFISLLDLLLPNFFEGARAHFDSLDDRRSHLRHTKVRFQPNGKTLETIRAWPVYRMEKEFYDFAVRQFDAQISLLQNGSRNGELSAQDDAFHYDKIKPSS